uniref:Monocyte to macrophage differentiation-associated n=1 Tax=Cyprinus carpio carpio TaxID=630221 RepID=A0A8C1CQM5_CYPCA
MEGFHHRPSRCPSRCPSRMQWILNAKTSQLNNTRKDKAYQKNLPKMPRQRRYQLLIVPAFVGMALLHRLSDDRWERITAWVYGMGLIALFLVSTVFHIISWKKSHMRTMEHCFHMCDRVVIYFFIAASYTPWLNLRELGPLAAHMRWFVWLMAAAGTIYVFNYHEKYKLVELVFYLTMGFFPALVMTSMNNTDGLYELAFGGLVYCLGVVFFKSDGVIPFAHAIWHVFVALAAAIHYYAIYEYLYHSPSLEDIRDA